MLDDGDGVSIYDGTDLLQVIRVLVETTIPYQIGGAVGACVVFRLRNNVCYVKWRP